MTFISASTFFLASPQSSLCTPYLTPLSLQSPSYPLYLSRSSLSSSKSSVYSSKRPSSSAWTDSSSERILSVAQLITNWVTSNKSSFNPDQHVGNLCLRCGKPHDTVKVALVGSDRTVAAMATSYSEMLSQSTKKCGKLDFEFYYIPLRTHTVPHKNIEISQYKIYIKSEYNLSDYVCHMDPLYAQKLFYPTHTVLRILPSIKPCPETQEVDKTSRDPALILRNALNGYILHANTTYNLSGMSIVKQQFLISWKTNQLVY